MPCDVLSDCKPVFYIILIGSPNEPGSLQGECTLVWVPHLSEGQGEGEMSTGDALSPVGRECIQNPQIYPVMSAELHITTGPQWAPVWEYSLFHFFLATLTLSQSIRFFHLQPLWATSKTQSFLPSLLGIWFTQTGVGLLSLPLPLGSQGNQTEYTSCCSILFGYALGHHKACVLHLVN